MAPTKGKAAAGGRSQGLCPPPARGLRGCPGVGPGTSRSSGWAETCSLDPTPPTGLEVASTQELLGSWLDIHGPANPNLGQGLHSPGAAQPFAFGFLSETHVPIHPPNGPSLHVQEETLKSMGLQPRRLAGSVARDQRHLLLLTAPRLPGYDATKFLDKDSGPLLSLGK